MRDWLIWISGWLGMYGVFSFHDVVAKWLSMILAVGVYAVITIFWRKAA